MLESLHIENIAVIKSVDIDLEGGLCVLTGETGAGKSLLIDSVSFLTGGRVSRDLIRAGEDRALVSALFSPPEGELAEALTELGIELPEGMVCFFSGSSPVTDDPPPASTAVP